MGRPLWTPPQGKDLDEKPPVPPACLTPITTHYSFFRPGSHTPPTITDNFPSYSSSSSSSSSPTGTLGQTLGLRHSRLTDDDQQRRSRSARHDDMVMRSDSSMLTLDEFLRETSAASATRDEAERHLHNLLYLRRRIGSERIGTERAGSTPAPPWEAAPVGSGAQWRNLFEHTPAGRRRILGAIPLDPEYVSRAPRDAEIARPGRDNEIPGRSRGAESSRGLENTGLVQTSRGDESLLIADVPWRPPISRDVGIARETIPRTRGDVQVTWRPSTSRSAEVSQRSLLSRDVQESPALTQEGRRDTVPPVPARSLTAHLILPGALQPTRTPGLYQSLTPSRVTPATTWSPPLTSSPPSSLSQQDSFDTLVGQIRRIGALQDYMLSTVDSATTSLEDNEAGENESTPEEDRERSVFASLRVREARLRAMQSRIDLLASEFALLSNTRHELRRVEAEAMASLQEASARNRASLQETSTRGLSLRDARNSVSLPATTETDRTSGRSRTQEAVERYITNRRTDEYNATLAGIPVVRVGRRVNVQEGDARRWAGGVEAGREGQMGMTRRQRDEANMEDWVSETRRQWEEANMAGWTSETREGMTREGRMTAGLREALMRSAVMRMQIEALSTEAI